MSATSLVGKMCHFIDTLRQLAYLLIFLLNFFINFASNFRINLIHHLSIKLCHTELLKTKPKPITTER